MNKNFVNPYQDIYKAVVFMYLINLTDVSRAFLNLNLPLVRYFFATTAVFYFIRGVYFTTRNTHALNPVTRNAFYLLFVATVIMIARGMPVIWEGAGNYINFKLFISGQLLIFILPLIVFSEPNLVLLKKIFRMCYLLAVIYVIITIPLLGYFTKEIYNGGESVGVLLAAGASILLLTQSYHSIKVRRVAIITFILVLLINLLLARRNQVLYFGSIVFFYIMIHFFAGTGFARRKRASFIVGFLVASFLVASYVYVYQNKFSYFYERSQTGMQSREYVINNFIEDYLAHPDEFIMGRGMNGLVAGGVNTDTGKREGIENGYLLHLLKGGWVYLGLIILIILPAIYLGFFKSNNILSKAFAAILVTYLLDMIGFGIPELTMKYLMVWIGIGVCYSGRIRSYSDEYIKSIVGLK
jgi:hypothetical protein